MNDSHNEVDQKGEDELNEPLLLPSGLMSPEQPRQLKKDSESPVVNMPPGLDDTPSPNRPRGDSTVRPLLEAEAKKTGIDTKRYLMTPGPVHRKIDRETILPNREVEKKKEIILEIETETKKKSFWSYICPCIGNKKVQR